MEEVGKILRETISYGDPRPDETKVHGDQENRHNRNKLLLFSVDNDDYLDDISTDSNRQKA